MTRKLVIVNMSNRADEAYELTDGRGKPEMLRPGEYQILHEYINVIGVAPITDGTSDGYEPPEFPSDAIRYSQETTIRRSDHLTYTGAA